MLCVTCPDVPFVSDFREFYVNSIIHISHTAESRLSRRAWPCVESLRMVSLKEGSYFCSLCQASEVLRKKDGCVLRALDSHLCLSVRSTEGPRGAPTWIISPYAFQSLAHNGLHLDIDC